jgi:hypothetical protein
MPPTLILYEDIIADSRTVSAVRVVAHTLGPVGPNTSDNHWSIYLISQDNSGSIQSI